jgi:hypothetical protein
MDSRELRGAREPLRIGARAVGTEGGETKKRHESIGVILNVSHRSNLSARQSFRK